MGAGFEPKQEVALLVGTQQPDMPGAAFTSDIRDNVDPQPVANERGMWITVWDCGALISKKLLSEGTYTLFVTEPHTYGVLATAPFALVDTSKPYDNWPNWAKVLFPKPAAPATTPAAK